MAALRISTLIINVDDDFTERDRPIHKAKLLNVLEGKRCGVIEMLMMTL